MCATDTLFNALHTKLSCTMHTCLSSNGSFDIRFSASSPDLWTLLCLSVAATRKCTNRSESLNCSHRQGNKTLSTKEHCMQGGRQSRLLFSLNKILNNKKRTFFSARSSKVQEYLPRIRLVLCSLSPGLVLQIRMSEWCWQHANKAPSLPLVNLKQKKF